MPMGERHLILIDIENLTCSPSPSEALVKHVVLALRNLLPDFDTAHRIVACSHHAAPQVAFAFPGARHLWRSGKDGADLALLDVLRHEEVIARFSRLTICSGDRIFAEPAAHFGAAGIDVSLISLPDSMAAELRLTVQHHAFLPLCLGAETEAS